MYLTSPKFQKQNKYVNISEEKEGILIYTGRILDTQEIETPGNLSSVMKDLCSTTFCVPIIEKYSPIAHSIASEVHWYDPVAKHRGIKTL